MSLTCILFLDLMSSDFFAAEVRKQKLIEKYKDLKV